METTYRVIKLNSGEEIIAKIKGEITGNMLIERPMIFKSSTAFDAFGNQKEVTYLRNWLSFSDQIETKISTNNVLTVLTPDSFVISLYDKEKEREDTRPSDTILSPMKPNIPTNKKTLEDFMGELEDMIDPELNPDMEDDVDPSEYLKKMGFDPNQLSHIMDQFFESEDKPTNHELVNLNISFDPTILRNLVDNDIIPPEYLLRLIEKFNNHENITDEFTGDENDREDFGNKWSDWNQNPDSEDYT